MPPQSRSSSGTKRASAFSFYGMRNILTVFSWDWLLRTRSRARWCGRRRPRRLPSLVFGDLLTPLLGAPRRPLPGKYRTHPLHLLLYCAGHACLAVFHDDPMVCTLAHPDRLGRAASSPASPLGRGPVHRGEQAPVNKVFAMFYWSINLGSFFASSRSQDLAPVGAVVAFGIPGILMALATIVLLAWAATSTSRSRPRGRTPIPSWRAAQRLAQTAPRRRVPRPRTLPSTPARRSRR